jgi:hypothetical protein
MAAIEPPGEAQNATRVHPRFDATRLSWKHGISLPTTSVFEENRFGSPLRYVGVQLAAAGPTGGGVSLASTTDIMMAAFGLTFRAQQVGWFGGGGVTVEWPATGMPSVVLSLRAREVTGFRRHHRRSVV